LADSILGRFQRLSDELSGLSPQFRRLVNLLLLLVMMMIAAYGISSWIVFILLLDEMPLGSLPGYLVVVRGSLLKDRQSPPRFLHHTQDAVQHLFLKMKVIPAFDFKRFV